MDSQQLKAFLAVVEHGSFSEAAEQLFLTQSAVSKRIQTLEQQLDTQLFERHNRSVSLSESGELLLPRAKHILQLMDDTQLQLTNLSGSVTGVLSMATSHHIGLHRLPPFLKDFARRYPQARLDLQFLGSEDAYRAVEQRSVELALTTLDSNASKQLQSWPLWQDELHFVVSREHPLANRIRTSLADLSQWPAILPEKDTITYRLVEQQFIEGGQKLHTSMPTNYLETIKMMVSVGLGWSVLPPSMIDDQLIVLDCDQPPLTRELGIIHLRNRPQSNAANAMMALLKSTPDI